MAGVIARRGLSLAGGLVLNGAQELRRTPLHALHRALGARMTAFAGWELPLHYRAGILAEHRHTRSAASLFDVSHMGQARLRGPGAAGLLEALSPTDALGLAPGRQRYALFTNPGGGIVDDFVYACEQDSIYLVVNAARRAADWALFPAGALEVVEGRALLALQGPCAALVLARLAPGVESMPFQSVRERIVAGIPCRVSRSGYTGEDGFELSVEAASAEPLARALLAEEGVQPAGLGARDSLRLEAGLCLYGQELDEGTTPVEAALEWTVSPARRPGAARPGGFPGAERILRELAQGAARRRVGLLPEGRAPVRAGDLVEDASGRTVGRVTSGGFGATVGGPVAMAYVESLRAAPGTRLWVRARGERRAARVAAFPFVPHRYFRERRP